MHWVAIAISIGISNHDQHSDSITRRQVHTMIIVAKVAIELILNYYMMTHLLLYLLMAQTLMIIPHLSYICV